MATQVINYTGQGNRFTSGRQYFAFNLGPSNLLIDSAFTTGGVSTLNLNRFSLSTLGSAFELHIGGQTNSPNFDLSNDFEQMGEIEITHAAAGSLLFIFSGADTSQPYLFSGRRDSTGRDLGPWLSTVHSSANKNLVLTFTLLESRRVAGRAFELATENPHVYNHAGEAIFHFPQAEPEGLIKARAEPNIFLFETPPAVPHTHVDENPFWLIAPEAKSIKRRAEATGFRHEYDLMAHDRTRASGDLWEWNAPDLDVPAPFGDNDNEIIDVRLRDSQIRFRSSTNGLDVFSEDFKARGEIIFFEESTGYYRFPPNNFTADGRIDAGDLPDGWAEWWDRFRLDRNHDLTMLFVLPGLPMDIGAGMADGTTAIGARETIFELATDLVEGVVYTPAEARENQIGLPLPRPAATVHGQPSVLPFEMSQSRPAGILKSSAARQNPIRLSQSRPVPTVVGVAEERPISLLTERPIGTTYRAYALFNRFQMATDRPSGVRLRVGVPVIESPGIEIDEQIDATLKLATVALFDPRIVEHGFNIPSFSVVSDAINLQISGPDDWRTETTITLTASIGSFTLTTHPTPFSGSVRRYNESNNPGIVAWIAAFLAANDDEIGFRLTYGTAGPAVAIQMSAPDVPTIRKALPSNFEMAISEPRAFLRSVAAEPNELEIAGSRPARNIYGNPDDLPIEMDAPDARGRIASVAAEERAFTLPASRPAATVIGRPRRLRFRMHTTDAQGFLRSVAAEENVIEIEKDMPIGVTVARPNALPFVFRAPDARNYLRSVAATENPVEILAPDTQRIGIGRPKESPIIINAIESEPSIRGAPVGAERLIFHMRADKPRSYLRSVAASTNALTFTAPLTRATVHGQPDDLTFELASDDAESYLRSVAATTLTVRMRPRRARATIFGQVEESRFTINRTDTRSYLRSVAARSATFTLDTDMVRGERRRIASIEELHIPFATGDVLSYLRSVAASASSFTLRAEMPRATLFDVAGPNPFIMRVPDREVRSYLRSVAVSPVSVEIAAPEAQRLAIGRPHQLTVTLSARDEVIGFLGSVAALDGPFTFQFSDPRPTVIGSTVELDFTLYTSDIKLLRSRTIGRTFTLNVSMPEGFLQSVAAIGTVYEIDLDRPQPLIYSLALPTHFEFPPSDVIGSEPHVRNRARELMADAQIRPSTHIVDARPR